MDNAFFNVRHYGAIGDGNIKDTGAIQQAIDACASAGGGTVLAPAGQYLIGTIYLKSNVELHLSAGATFIGSPDREDYNADDIFSENYTTAVDFASGGHLIIAYQQKNVSITGTGTIDGNSAAFFDPLPETVTATYRYKNGNYPIPGWRTGAMVYFCRTERIRIEGVSLLNAPYWTLLLLGCKDASLHGLTIENPPATRNGDGIDIDCSQRVMVSHCTIRTGDDCITLRGNKRPLGDQAGPCEDVVVTNCILSTPCSAIRIGVGLGEIRRCSFSNIVIPEARTAISFNASYNANSHGTLIEQISFTSFIIDAINPIVVALGPGAAEPAAIRDIRFDQFQIRASAGSQLTGKPSLPIERLRMTNFDWVIHGGTDNREFTEHMPEELWIGGYQGVDGAPALPCALYGVYLEDAVFSSFRIQWEALGNVWQDGIWLEHSRRLELHHIRLRQPKDDEGAALYFSQCSEVLVRDCQADAGTSTFVFIEGSAEDSAARLLHNDLVAARTPVQSDMKVLEIGNLYPNGN